MNFQLSHLVSMSLFHSFQIFFFAVNKVDRKVDNGSSTVHSVLFSCSVFESYQYSTQKKSCNALTDCHKYLRTKCQNLKTSNHKCYTVYRYFLSNGGSVKAGFRSHPHHMRIFNRNFNSLVGTVLSADQAEKWRHLKKCGLGNLPKTQRISQKLNGFLQHRLQLNSYSVSASVFLITVLEQILFAFVSLALFITETLQKRAKHFQIYQVFLYGRSRSPFSEACNLQNLLCE